MGDFLTLRILDQVEQFSDTLSQTILKTLDTNGDGFVVVDHVSQPLSCDHPVDVDIGSDTGFTVGKLFAPSQEG